jgi:transposase
MVMAKHTPSTPPPSGALSPKAARQRRLQAARLFAQGLPQAEVARRLGVSRQTASRWHARWRQGGREGLAGPGRWGRPSRLSEGDWRRVEHALLAGAQAHGFDTDLWTLPRVAEVIWRLTGVSYHPGHVWWLLRRHQWSPQRPARRAAERDEDAIARWRAEDWPRIKGGR